MSQTSEDGSTHFFYCRPLPSLKSISFCLWKNNQNWVSIGSLIKVIPWERCWEKSYWHISMTQTLIHWDSIEYYFKQTIEKSHRTSSFSFDRQQNRVINPYHIQHTECEQQCLSRSVQVHVWIFIKYNRYTIKYVTAHGSMLRTQDSQSRRPCKTFCTRHLYDKQR